MSRGASAPQRLANGGPEGPPDNGRARTEGPPYIWTTRQRSHAAVSVAASSNCHRRWRDPCLRERRMTKDAAASATSSCGIAGLPSAGSKRCRLGNGRLGAMVFGGVVTERLQLNDDTCGRAGRRTGTIRRPGPLLPEIRRAALAGDAVEADRLAKQMMGPFTQSYQPLGDLRSSSSTATSGREYRRELDLATAAVARPFDTPLAMRSLLAKSLRATRRRSSRSGSTVDRPGRLTFVARLSSLLRSSTEPRIGDLRLRGRAPAHVDPSYHDQDGPGRLQRTMAGCASRFGCAG